MLSTVKYPMMRPQRYSTLQKPISGYQPQVGSDRVALINIPARALGNDQVQQIVVHFITTEDPPRLLTVNSDCQVAVSSPPMHLQAKHAPRVTPPIAHATCRNLDRTRNVYSSAIATRKTAVSTPDMPCLHTAVAMNRHWLRQALLAPYARTSSQKN